jgi:hypothetical protein
MPFIQVTCEGTDAPIRHTVSLAGAAAAADEPLLEPQPATPAAAPASTTAAPMVAADLVRFTLDLPSRLFSRASVRRGDATAATESGPETNRKVSYKIESVARLRQFVLAVATSAGESGSLRSLPYGTHSQ